MAVRSKALCIAVQLGAGSVAYTTSAGETTLIKSVVCKNATAVSTSFRFGYGNSSGVGQMFELTVAAGGVGYVDLWLVCPENQTVNVSASPASNNARISLFGAELEGIAD